MPFSPHDPVYIIPAKRKGKVLKEVRTGEYLVLIGDLQLRCRETDLRLSRKSEAPPAAPPSAVKVPESGSAPAAVDLHGLTVDEAVRRVEEAINRCILAGSDELEVIHGVGSGKVKHAVYQRLGELRAVKRFVPAQGNPGSTRVYF